jgi:cell division protein FtsA
MKHRHKPRGSLLAALDVGSSKIACFIARVVDDEGSFEVLGVGHHASSGIKSGNVVDLEAAEAAIRSTVHAAENMAADVMKGYPLREVVVNLPGTLAKSHSHRVDIQVMGHEVTDNDVRRALAKAQDKAAQQDHELIHTIAMGYRIDGHDGIRQPRGLFGQHMQVDIHMVTGDSNALRNMATSIGRSHLDITAFGLAPYAAGLACLVEDEMDLGCTVIDMGGGVTSFAVFHGGALVYADAIPIGGQHVTSDIAAGLTTSLNDAERLKALYGNALASGHDDGELIDVPRIACRVRCSSASSSRVSRKSSNSSAPAFPMPDWARRWGAASFSPAAPASSRVFVIWVSMFSTNRFASAVRSASAACPMRFPARLLPPRRDC